MTNQLRIFLPCSAQTESLLEREVQNILMPQGIHIQSQRGGVQVSSAQWKHVLQLNLHSRIAQRVLLQMAHGGYASEDDIYELAKTVAWEEWFNVRQTFRIDITSQKSPLKSLNFALLRVKDAIVDRFRERSGSRPSIETRFADIRIHLHLSANQATLYLDTSGEPLFKRGWREDKGDAPLKETLAASLLAAIDWNPKEDQALPLYDPCCGSGTIVIEAAQMACNIAPGSSRRFGFEKLLAFKSQEWQDIRNTAKSQERASNVPIFGSDISHRMVDFAKRNASRAGVFAGVLSAIELRGGDALQRQPPTQTAGVMLFNPPYGERIGASGHAGRNLQERRQTGFGSREFAGSSDGSSFYLALSSHWKSYYAGWTAWLLSPDMELSRKLRLKESRRIPLWNGAIECRLFRFDISARVVRNDASTSTIKPTIKP